MPGPDSGGTTTDAPSRPGCGERIADGVCLDHVRAGVATEITLPLGELEESCFCEQDLLCEATIAGPGRLALSTRLCPEIPLCRACGRNVTGRCTLPPLTEGTWQVEINGQRSLELTVVPEDVLPERADVCIRRAIDDGCGTLWPALPFDVGRACHEASVQPGTRAHLRIFDACGGCMQRGPCEVTVVDGFIRARATRMPSGCDLVCPPACIFDEHVCITPPLAEGDYQVIVEGLLVDETTTLRVEAGADGGETCAGG